MPKMKTHKGASKRFKVTGSGKFKRNHAYTSHILEHKSPKQKRNLRKSALASENDAKRISRMLPYA
ncbi:MAG TPA: 50S ribosomal protein L35 [Firmicutes bacterium]|nr:50S ribosomal protein L35 [Bacillota bacterium]